jgi:hypothetical protein
MAADDGPGAAGQLGSAAVKWTFGHLLLAKAGWITLIVVLPFIGSLIYLIATPRLTADERKGSP